MQTEKRNTFSTMDNFTLFSWPSGTQKMRRDGETKHAELMIKQDFFDLTSLAFNVIRPGHQPSGLPYTCNKHLHSCMGQINPNLLKKAFAT